MGRECVLQENTLFRSQISILKSRQKSNSKLKRKTKTMCIAMSGLVTEIDGDTATVEIMGNKIKANTGLVDIAVGDYALVHAGCIIEKLKKDTAEELDDVWKELKSVLD
jgi:hydrogenase expression/formation protein HypC